MSYNQTTLHRHDPSGTVATTVTYIPSNLAVVGKKIQLRQGETKKDETWEDWIVSAVSAESISDEVAKKIKIKWHGGWNNNI